MGNNKTKATLHNLRKHTGVKDFRNVDIYEGDILAPDNYTDFPYTVKFENGDFYLYSIFGRWGLLWEMRNRCEKLNIKMVVTGNIHENSELTHNLW